MAEQINLVPKYILIISLLFCSFTTTKINGVSRNVSGFFILNPNTIIIPESAVSARNSVRPLMHGYDSGFLLTKINGGFMKQNLRPVPKPAIQEAAIPSVMPLSEGLDQLHEIIQLLECQSDALTGIAVLHDDLGHQSFLNIVISQKLQAAYENIFDFFHELRSSKGVRL